MRITRHRQWPKSRMGVVLMVCCMIGIFLLFITAAGVQGYTDAQETAQLKKTGMRVVAEIGDIHTGYSDDVLYYYTDYVYVDSDGVRYTGSAGKKYRTEAEARTHFGEEIEIIIGKNGQSVRANIPVQTGAFYNMMLIGGLLLGADALIALTLGVMLVLKRMQTPKEEREKSGLGWYVYALLGVVFFGFILLAGSIAFRRSILMRVALVAIFGGGFVAALAGILSLFIPGKRNTTKANREKESVVAYEQADAGVSVAAADTAAEESDAVPLQTEEVDEKTQEAENIAEINQTYGVENQMAMGMYQISHVKKAYRTSNAKEKVFSALFLCVLLALFIGCAVCMLLGHPVAGGLCLGGFAGIIIIAGITVSVKQRLSLRGSGYTGEILHGKVKTCLLSGSTSSGGRRHQHMTSVVYRVLIDADGEEKVAYSRAFYNEGDNVTVRCHPKRKTSVTIIEPRESLVCESEPEKDDCGNGSAE